MTTENINYETGEVTQQQTNPPMIYRAMANIMRDSGHIAKANKNQQQNFMFRGIDDVYNALHDVFAKHGVFSMPEVIKSEREEKQTARGGTVISTLLTIKYTFYAEDGSFVTAIVQSEAMDSGDKSTSKSMSIAHKYCLLQALKIPTNEPDPDSYSYELGGKEPAKPKPKSRTINDEEYDALKQEISECGLSYNGVETYVKRKLQVNSLKELPYDMLKQLCNKFPEMIKAKEAAAKKAETNASTK